MKDGKIKVARTIEEEQQDFFKQFHKEDDRSAVILSGAMIDLMLGELLRKVFLPASKAVDPLLNERGPLSSLYSKNVMAHRLGLIDDNLRDTIDIIRDIRNTYAHRLEYSGLSSQPYSSKIEQAYKLISWYDPIIAEAKKIYGAEENGAMQFRLTSAIVALRLKLAVAEQKPLYSPSPKPLIPEKWEVMRLGKGR